MKIKNPPPRVLRRLACVLLSLSSTLLFAESVPVMRGVNMSAAGFGSSLPGTYGVDYIYPDASYLDYYKSRGIELIRFPFKWERIQRTLYGNLDAVELARLDTFLDDVEQRGMRVILDLHNYGRYRVSGTDRIIGSPEVPRSAFQDVWEKLAAHVKDRDCIWAYDIMNEPHDMGAYTWKDSAQVAVNGIRLHDMRHAILLPGDQFSGAYRWLTAGANLLEVVDPADNVIFQAHQYFDFDSSGRYTKSYDDDGATPNIGVQRLTDFVNWCNTHGVRGFIGEYGVPDNDPRWLTILENSLAYLAANNISCTYWAGGPWWGSYALSSEMRQLAREAPQMPIITEHGDGVGTRYWPPYIWYKDAIAPSPQGTYPYLNKSGTATVVANFYDTDSATGTYTQARSVRISGTIPVGGNANGGFQINGGVNITPNVDRDHVLSFYIKGTPGSSIRVFLRDSTNTNSTKIDSANYVTTDGTWRQVRIPLSALLDGTSVNTGLLTRISYDVLPADGQERVWQLDQFAIEKPEAVAPVTTVAATGGTSFSLDTPFEATATATDASGIDFVEFLIDGQRLAIDETTPYSATLTLTEEGAHRLTAIAYDIYGNPGRSTPVTLTAAATADYQAEDAPLMSGVVVTANHAGYTGTGFADYGGQNSYVEWNNVYAPSAGTYTLSFRYALAGSPRPCEVKVNGVSAGSTAFVTTNNWANWVVENKTVTLAAGNNTIRLTAATSAGGPNVDKMTRN